MFLVIILTLDVYYKKKINNFCNSSPPPAIIAVYVLYQKCIVGLICPDLAARRVKKRFAAYKNATNYRTGAIITRGLDVLNQLFEGQQRIFKVFFLKLWSYVRLVFKSGL